MDVSAVFPGERLARTNLVSQPELLLAQAHAATQTLGDAEALFVQLTRELEADATET